MMRIATFLFLVLVLTACAGTGATRQPAAGEPGHGAAGNARAAAGQTCEGYGPTDDCMNQDTFAQCQTAAATCPGKVRVMETCPLQFSCE